MLILSIVFAPFLCGILSYLIGKKSETARDYFVILVTGAILGLTLVLYRNGPASFCIRGVLACGLSFASDGFRSVYAVIASMMWAGTALFAKEYFKEERENLNRYWFFVIVTLGATEGVMLSDDLMTAFLFFEILSFTSFTWVIHEETKAAVRAGYTYLFIAVIGGLVLFMGLALLYDAVGTLAYGELSAAVQASLEKGKLLAAGVCILLGFGAKAGMVPVHVWLPKAHPAAPSPASALLSGILTKVGIFGILMTSMHVLAGNRTFGLLVLLLGVVTMFLGALLALFSVNLKRTLACSSMSQIGFILTGTGMMILLDSIGNEEGVVIARSGLMLHMVNHSLIKLTLFMAAGVVVMNLHTLTLDEIRGYGRNKRVLKISFLLGALGISGVPLANGYLSKTLLHEGIVEGIHHLSSCAGLLSCIEWIFLISGGFTFAYMLKLFLCVFVEKNTDPGRQALFDSVKSPGMNGASALAVFGSSLWMLILGQPAVSTRLAFRMTGFEEILHFRAFTFENLKGSFISLTIGGLVYLFVVRRFLVRGGSYVNLWPEKLDLEESVYRPVLTRILPGIFGPLAALFGENRILKPLAVLFGEKVFPSLAALFGENRLLTPAARFVMLIASILVRAMEMGTDGLIVLLRRTVVKERKVRGKPRAHPGLFRTVYTELSGAARPITSNFTFALMMTCIGIIIILCAVIYAVL